MKKIITIALALSVSVTAVSCKKSLNKIENAIEKSGEDQSQAIIDFNNNFLESYKSTSRHVENIIQYAEAAVKKSQGETVYSMPMVISSMDYSLSKIKGVPSGFDSDQKIIETELATYKAKREILDKKYEELKSYMTSEDYKDDQGAKALALQKDIDAEAKAFFMAGENIVTKIKPATEAAEEVILKDHPMRDYIISSKSVMNDLDATMDVLDKQYAQGFNEAEAQKKYNELEKAVDVNAKKQFDVDGQQYTNKKTLFENFNKRASEFLDKYRKLIRDSKAANKIPDSNIQEISSAYDSVLNSYNSFVQ